MKILETLSSTNVVVKKVFLRGIQATLPLLLTFAIIIWAFSIIEAFFGAIIQDTLGNKYYFKGLGFLLGITLIFCVGLIVNLWIIQGLYQVGENLLQRVPIIKTIYKSLVDFMAFFSPQADKKTGSPVLVETPLGKVLAFITVDTPDNLPPGLQNNNQIAVYIPLSYQIGGITVFLPKEKIIPLDMPIDKAMSFVLTAGMTGQPS